MSADKNDTNQPILILVRRGRGGRGFLVSPVDAPTDAAPCSTANEVGDVVLELLDDENQPRVNLDQILAMASDDYEPEEEDGEDERVNGESRPVEASPADEDDESDGDDEDGEEEDEDEEDPPWWDVRGAADPADKLLVNMIGGVLGKAQQASSRKRRGRHRRARPKKKTK